MKTPKISQNKQSITHLSTDALIVATPAEKLSPTAQIINQSSNGWLRRALIQDDFIKQGYVWLYQVPGIKAKRLLLVKCPTGTLSIAQYIKLVMTAWKAFFQSESKTVNSALHHVKVKGADDIWCVSQSIMAAFLQGYAPQGGHKDRLSTLQQIKLQAWDDSSSQTLLQGIRQGSAIATGQRLTRHLADSPANLCTPQDLANTARQLARSHSSLSTQILNHHQMKKLGMGALLAVGQGSANPPKLIVVHYKGGKKRTPPVVLVGKGITFDTGGICIKPRTMMDMKYDMSGGATVMGMMQVCAGLNLPFDVIGVIAAAENMPSGHAFRPSDVITSYSGQTIEVVDTDAEGRLVLADALTYCKRFKPELVIDLATLTGSMVLALGEHAAGVMSSDDNLSRALVTAGEKAHDRLWPLPLWPEYGEVLDSNCADMMNVSPNRSAGAIVAGCFLQKFADSYPWAHIDIAGVANTERGGLLSTGRPVSMLSQFLLDRV